ncbi:hypothetical protein R3W88_027070 [Solanum pinnatisectum]|uniref:Uncharacterized protein n=1 Tax=Solanum pinnatisectum TaxID=50273 RepID=A0AAV9LF94_9SOLN|nr:hypothetical protein R3W88_027070 [Solanum pinnatisectum]
MDFLQEIFIYTHKSSEKIIFFYSFCKYRNLLDKEFRYLRTVIVMSTIHRGFGHRLPCHQVTNFLNLPALCRRQRPYMVLRLCEDLRFGKQSPEPCHCNPLCEEALLVPKLRSYFAEFLRENYFALLSILYLPTYVGLGYKYPLT